MFLFTGLITPWNQDASAVRLIVVAFGFHDDNCSKDDVLIL